MSIFKKKSMSQRVFCSAKKTAKKAGKQAKEQPLQVPVAIAATIYVAKETVHGAKVVSELALVPVKYVGGTFGKAFKLAKIKSKKWKEYLENMISSTEEEKSA